MVAITYQSHHFHIEIRNIDRWRAKCYRIINKLSSPDHFNHDCQYAMQLHTLVVVPVLYALVYRIKAPAQTGSKLSTVQAPA